MFTDKITSDRTIIAASALAVVAVAAGLYYYFHVLSEPAVPTRPSTPVSAPKPPAAHPETAIEHPVPRAPEAAESAPLPTLETSDAPLAMALAGVSGAAGVGKFLVPQSLVRHIVVTVDNLPRKKAAVELRPVRSPPGQFATAGPVDHPTLSSENFARYKPIVELVKSTDAKELAAVYFRFYPLFQQSYENLGYPDRYFNDRVIEVIDNLLATPEPKGPIELAQPNVMYLYADPALEQLSAGQKALIRMGPDNAAVVKAKLRELRAILATHPK